MRITTKKFAEAADKAVNKTLRAGKWYCLKSYQYVEDGADVYAEAEWSRFDDEGYYQPYTPLRLTGLFLEFAQLGGKKEITREDWQDWVERWGVLGVGKTDFCGGPGESLARFVDEARQAHRALSLHERESALNDEELLELGLLVQRKLRKYTRSQLYRAGSNWVLSEEFDNLLGAIWLQMAWLMTAPPGAVKRCEYCNGIINFKIPEEITKADLERIGGGRRSPYKPRSDRKYHDGCRQLAYYRRKKARQQR